MISKRYQAEMKDVLVRAVPEELHGWLKEEAARNNRSVSSEVLALVGEARESRVRVLERVARIEAWRKKYLPGGGVDLDDIARTIREDRDHGH